MENTRPADYESGYEVAAVEEYHETTLVFNRASKHMGFKRMAKQAGTWMLLE